MGNFRAISAALLAISLHFPSIAIFNFGASTGVQLSMLSLGLCGFAYFSNRLNLRFTLWFALIASLLAVQIIIFGLQSKLSDVYLKNLIHFSFSLAMIPVAYAVGRNHYAEFSTAYFNLTVLTAIFGIAQFISWYLLDIDLPLFRGINNNNSFSNAGAVRDVADLDRAFGFAPEPAMFALLLLPGFAIALARKSRAAASIIAGGLLSTQALTALVLLPIFLFYRYQRLRAPMLGIAILILVVGASMLRSSLGDWVSFSDVRAGMTLAERVAAIGADGSVISRINSLFIALDAISESPLIGLGYTDRLNNLITLSSIAAVEVNSGINSLALLLAAVFGLPFLAVIVAPVVISAVNSAETYKPMVVGLMVVPSLLSLGYYSFHLPWVGIGLAASLCFPRELEKRYRYETGVVNSGPQPTYEPARGCGPIGRQLPVS